MGKGKLPKREALVRGFHSGTQQKMLRTVTAMWSAIWYIRIDQDSLTMNVQPKEDVHAWFFLWQEVLLESKKILAHIYL